MKFRLLSTRKKIQFRLKKKRDRKTNMNDHDKAFEIKSEKQPTTNGNNLFFSLRREYL